MQEHVGHHRPRPHQRGGGDKGKPVAEPRYHGLQQVRGDVDEDEDQDDWGHVGDGSGGAAR